MTRLALLPLVLALAACYAGDRATSVEGNVEQNVRSAMGEASQRMQQENLKLDAVGAPNAEITPNGELLVGGTAVPTTAEQRALLQDYRRQILAVAAAGMDIGAQGAALAVNAMGEAFRGVISGNPDEVEKRVEAQADKIRASAAKICDHLPGLYATQEKLKAALPAFAPYAEIEMGNIDECRKDVADNTPPAAPTAPAAPAAPTPPVAQATNDSTASDLVGEPKLPELP